MAEVSLIDKRCNGGSGRVGPVAGLVAAGY